jgi:hypothetical protein
MEIIKMDSQTFLKTVSDGVLGFLVTLPIIRNIHDFKRKPKKGLVDRSFGDIVDNRLREIYRLESNSRLTTCDDFFETFTAEPEDWRPIYGRHVGETYKIGQQS